MPYIFASCQLGIFSCAKNTRLLNLVIVKNLLQTCLPEDFQNKYLQRNFLLQQLVKPELPGSFLLTESFLLDIQQKVLKKFSFKTLDQV